MLHLARGQHTREFYWEASDGECCASDFKSLREYEEPESVGIKMPKVSSLAKRCPLICGGSQPTLTGYTLISTFIDTALAHVQSGTRSMQVQKSQSAEPQNVKIQ